MMSDVRIIEGEIFKDFILSTIPMLMLFVDGMGTSLRGNGFIVQRALLRWH